MYEVVSRDVETGFGQEKVKNSFLYTGDSWRAARTTPWGGSQPNISAEGEGPNMHCSSGHELLYLAYGKVGLIYMNVTSVK